MKTLSTPCVRHITPQRSGRHRNTLILATLVGALATGCGTTTESDSSVSSASSASVSQEQDISDSTEEESNHEATPQDSESTPQRDLDALEEKMREVLGDQTTISRSNTALRSRELGNNMMTSDSPLYDETCVAAEEEATAFRQSNAEHMTGLISEADSLTPSNPPSVEWVVVETFSTLDDAQMAQSLEVAATQVCAGDDAQLEETQRSIDGTVISVVNEMIGEGLFDQPFVSSQEVRFQKGTAFYTYRYQPDMSAGFDGFDLSLSNDELFESAGRKLLAIADY